MVPWGLGSLAEMVPTLPGLHRVVDPPLAIDPPSRHTPLLSQQTQSSGTRSHSSRKSGLKMNIV